MQAAIETLGLALLDAEEEEKIAAVRLEARLLEARDSYARSLSCTQFASAA